MAKITVKAVKDFNDQPNAQWRAKGSEFTLKDDYAKTLVDNGSVELVKDKKKEPSAKEKRIADKREKALIDQEGQKEKKIIERPGMEIVEKVKKPAK